MSKYPRNESSEDLLLYQEPEPLSAGGLQREAFLEKRRKRLFRLGCCACLLALLLILLPLIFFVGIPKFGQYLVDASVMSIEESIIEKAGSESFLLRLRGNVTDAGMFNADITFNEPVVLKWEGIELARIPMHPINYKAPLATIDELVNVTVTNVTAFTAFSRYMMLHESFVWDMEGSVTVASMGIRIPNLSIKKSLKLKGFNGLKDLVKIESFDLPSDDPRRGIKAVVVASIKNPSPVGVVLGKVEFDMLVNGTKIGAAVAKSLVLLPGNNTLAISGFLVPISSRDDAQVVSKLFTLFMSGDDSIITVSATKVYGDEPAPYIDDALVGFEMNTVFEGAKKLRLIETVAIGDMAMSLGPDAPYKPLLSAPAVVAKFKMPFDFPLEVSKVKQNILVIADGKKIATIDSGWISAFGSSYSGKIVMDLLNVPFAVIPGKEPDFEEFVAKTALGRGNVSMSLTGRCDTVASTAIGEVEIENLPFSSEISIPCMNGFMSVPPKVLTMKVVGGTERGVELALTVKLYNPSQLSLYTGDLTFDLYYANTRFGLAFMKDFKLEPGDNEVSVRALYNPSADALEKAREMLSLQAMGRPVKTACVGTSSSTDIKSLKPAMEQLKMVLTLPGLPNNMIQSTRFMIGPSTVNTGIGEAGMTVFNSFDTPITILSIQAIMLTEGSPLGRMNVVLDSPMIVPPHTAVASTALPLKVQISSVSILATLKGAAGSLRIKVISDLVVRINDYETSLHYEQSDVPSRLEKV